MKDRRPRQSGVRGVDHRQGHHEDRWPMHGYEPTREEAMTASAKSWRRRSGHDENTRVKSGHLARLPFRDGELEWRKSDPTKNRPRPLAGHQRRRHPEKATYPDFR